MSTIVKAADAAEFLSLVPRMLGYVPARSLVMIPFARSRSLGAMRFDLPADADIDAFASSAIGLVCRLPDADAVAAVAYTDARFDGERMPHPALFEALERRADASGLRMTDALCVAADGWGSMFDPGLPRGGRPLAELEVAPPGAEDIDDVDGDQSSGAELPAPGLVETERVGRALLAFARAAEVLCGDDISTAEPSDSVDDARVDPQALAAVCGLEDLPGFFEDALEWRVDDIVPYDAAAMVWCLARPSLRDVALVQWSGTFDDGDRALDAQLRWESGEEYPAQLAMRMWGEGDRPDPDRLERALALTRRIAALAPRESRPGALAMCAWLAWGLGLSTHADSYAREACAIEPEHGLSEIVRSFVQAGHLPDWAFRRPAPAR
ncbi:DUF4192 domain-containing protein [Microbacterium sp. SSM24]|uniref:DUF4192 domain-containing protein n=1 Tax=Microbacterium sp. SSM24 TaxID=2991714 RepID=UPI002227435D|nr:DUF4192 domain-containing protein [Microbacterium sp. SSM24]MCW3492743.1 DUF4192 domain-containing protein [Microbacterium sp. SSM24]